MSVSPVHFKYLTEEALKEWKSKEDGYRFTIGQGDEARFVYEICWAVLRGDLSRAKVSVALAAGSIGNEDKETIASLLADTIAQLGLEVPIGSSGEHRSRLADLGRWLIDSQQVSSRLLKERCELDYLAEIEEVKDVSLFKRKEIQINTRLHYTQTKFNLLREESEGYAKLLTLLSHQRSEAYTGKTFLPLVNAVKSLIGYFDLDPNRVLDVVLNCYELQPNNPAFLEIVTLFPKSNVPHILGFNLQFYQRPDIQEDVPESLYLLAARVVKANCVNLENVYAHLLPKDTEAIVQYKESHSRRIDEVNKIGKINLAATGRDLMEDDKPGDITIDLYAALDAEERAISARKEELDKNQKIGLLKSFLDIDDWPHSVVLLEHLGPLDPVEHEPICNALCRMIDRAIAPLYAMVKPAYLTRVSSNSVPSAAGETPAPMEVDGGKGKPFVEIPKEVFEMLTYVGPYLHRNVILLQKVCRLLRAHLVCAGAPANPPPAVGARGIPHQTTDAYPMVLLTAFSLIDDVLSFCLLPSLQLLPANPAVGMEIWEVMKLLPFHWRYRLYGEWDKDGDKTPILATARQVARMDTKKILRRLAKENLKPLGRMLAKIAHANPMTVLRTIVLQMEAYKDMIVPVVDAFKYLTQLEYDILEYVVIERFVQRGRDKLKEDGLNISDWLTSLASFWGHLCKKYPSMELRGLFQYLVNQLKRGEALELVMLQELITQMANIENVENLNDDQLEALAGGETVRQQSTSYNYTRNNKALAKSSARLRDALMPSSGVKLGVPLLILIAQQRTRLIVSTEAPHVKMISELFDRCHGTLMQYVEFLLNAVAPATAYAQLLPSLDELVHMYHLEPEVAFLIYRPILRLFKLKHGSMSASWPADMSKVAMAIQGSNADGADEAAALKSAGVARKEDIVLELEGNHPQTTWADILATVKGMLPARTWNSMSPELYITFWGLSLHDLYIPKKRYEMEIKKQEMSLKALEESADNSHVAIAKRKKDKERIQELLEKLTAEKQRQEHNVASVHQRLLREKDSWLSSCSDWSNTVTEFLQNCIFPRCVFSMMDAMYCAKFVHKIHSLGTPYFSTLKYVDHILCFDIQPLVCSCTEYEAGRLGRFLLETLRLLDHWKSTEEIYEKECHSLPGFATSFRDLNAKRAVYQDFVRVNFKWNHKLCRALVACLDSSEYIEIRNALTVLTKVVSVFPATRKIGSYIEKKVNKIKGEDREDLKVLATGVAAALASRKASWLTDEDFAGGVRLPSFTKAMSPSQGNAAGAPNASGNKSAGGTGGGVSAPGNAKAVAKPNTGPTPQVTVSNSTPSSAPQKSPTSPPVLSKSAAGTAAGATKQETPTPNAGVKPGATTGSNAAAKSGTGDAKDKAQLITAGASQGATAPVEASPRGEGRGNGLEEGSKPGIPIGKAVTPGKTSGGDGTDTGRPGSGRGTASTAGNKQGTQPALQQTSSAPASSAKQGVQSQAGGATTKTGPPKETVPAGSRGVSGNISPVLKGPQGTRTMNGSAQGASGNVGTRAANTGAGPIVRGSGDGKGTNEPAKGGGGRAGTMADTVVSVGERGQGTALARDRSASERDGEAAANVQKLDGGRQKGAGVAVVGRSPTGKGGVPDREDAGVELEDAAVRDRGAKRLPTDDGDRGSKRRKGMGDDVLERDAGGERDRRERSTDHGSAGGSVDGRHEDGRSRERSLDREKEDEEDEGTAKERKRRKVPAISRAC